MAEAASKKLAPEADVIAPDGCEVRVLAQTSGGSMAHFTLGPQQVSRAVAHRTVEELWYFLAGQGRMWRRLAEWEDIVEVGPGVSLSIPLGTHFQLRNEGTAPLAAVAVTIPPWPGEDEAYFVEGRWSATVGWASEPGVSRLATVNVRRRGIPCRCRPPATTRGGRP